MYGNELYYIIVIFALFVVPRILLRLRVPTAITCLLLGAIAGPALGLFVKDPTIKLLATFGIVALFLFAGLELDIHTLQKQAKIIIQHLVLHLIGLTIVAFLATQFLDISLRPAVLVALALLTPSAGFILDSLKTLKVSKSEEFWIRSKVIATELIALAALFAVLQSTTMQKLGLSLLVLLGIIAILPLVIKVFARLILPYAPKSEFAFLLMLAVVCAFVTRELGVYYLVGAFVAGVAAQRFREQLPSMASEDMLHAVEVFASFFVPFYFFSAGVHLKQSDFMLNSLLFGLVFLAIMTPLRIFSVAFHRRFALGESVAHGARIGVSMLPTLVFTLVIAEILREQFGVASHIFGGLIVYTLLNTIVPGFILKLPPPAYESPHLLDLDLHFGDEIHRRQVNDKSTGDPPDQVT